MHKNLGCNLQWSWILNHLRNFASDEHRSEVEPNSIQFEEELYELKKTKHDAKGEIESVANEFEAVEEAELPESKGDNYELARDRKRRAIKPPKMYAVGNLIAHTLTATHEINKDKLRTYREAITSKNKVEWKKAIDEEIASLMKNEL